MTKLLKEPLLHFLVAGAALFLLFELAGNDEDKSDGNVIHVSRETLLTFIQYRTRAFEPEIAEERLAELSGDALERVIDDYIREEALYREALALGMDKNDYVIKRRMIQSVEFITNGFVESTAAVSDDDVRAYYDENRDNYYIDPVVTFTHVFFSAERHGDEEAQALAEAKLAELNRDGAAFTDAPRHGDRYPYLVNYVERTLDLVASHVGDVVAASIFDAEPDGSTWIGPLRSNLGSHVVLLASKTQGRYPELVEVAAAVRRDAEHVALLRVRDKAIQGIVDSYEVRRTYEGAAAAK